MAGSDSGEGTGGIRPAPWQEELITSPLVGSGKFVLKHRNVLCRVVRKGSHLGG